MSCPFGKMFIPEGGKNNPNGLFIAINGIYNYGFIHTQASYLESGDNFKSVTEKVDTSIIPKQFTIYFRSSFIINNNLFLIINKFNNSIKTLFYNLFIKC